MKKSILKHTYIVILIFLVIQSSFAQRSISTFKTETPPIIDGKLDDPVWQTAPYITGFKTWMPDYDMDMSQKTRVYVAYDRENLYFAFRCFDTEPDKIKTSITNRDNVRADDWVCINLDTFNDHQSLYCFYCNPAGIQGDSKSMSGTWSEDKNYDTVWYSMGQIDSLGYTIEIRIPFKSIRFTSKNPVPMGVIFERSISRNSVQGTFPPLDPQRGMDWFNQSKPMVFQNIKHYKLFELLPAVTYSERHAMSDGLMQPEYKEEEFSLTTKYGFTSQLILDGTYNPDFSQVEADAGQVDINLRYDLFFPEKRPFFLEGRENFKTSGSSRTDPLRTLVHTRMIANPVLGVKLSGKVGEKDVISSIYALDELPENGNGDGKKDFARVAIFRYRRALHQDGYVGAIYTGREYEDSHNRVLGIDGLSRVNQSSTLGYYIVGSSNREVDETSSQDGYAMGYSYSYATRKLSIGLGMQDIAKEFLTKAGYITRTGVFLARASVGTKFYPSSKTFRRCDLTISNSYVRDKFDQLDETSSSLSLRFTLPKSTSFTSSINYSTEVYGAQKFDRSGVLLSGKSQFTKRFSLSVSYRYEKAIYYSSDPYQGRGTRASSTVIYQPSDKLHSQISLTYADFYRDLDSVRIYDYTIVRGRLTYQVNRYLFFRGIVEYNDYYEEMLTDFLASFTYIPGTVIHVGYGSIYNKVAWQNDRYVDSDRFLQTKKGLFFKASYLWRM